MNTAIRNSVYTQLREAQHEVIQLKDRVKQLSLKCFALSNERSKWERRYKDVKARLDRLTHGPDRQMEMYSDNRGNKVSPTSVEMYREAMNPQAEFTIAQVAAWAAANGVTP